MRVCSEKASAWMPIHSAGPYMYHNTPPPSSNVLSSRHEVGITSTGGAITPWTPSVRTRQGGSSPDAPILGVEPGSILSKDLGGHTF
jgi:hypothetical protein